MQRQEEKLQGVILLQEKKLAASVNFWTRYKRSIHIFLACGKICLVLGLI